MASYHLLKCWIVLQIESQVSYFILHCATNMQLLIGPKKKQQWKAVMWISLFVSVRVSERKLMLRVRDQVCLRTFSKEEVLKATLVELIVGEHMWFMFAWLSSTHVLYQVESSDEYVGHLLNVHCSSPFSTRGAWYYISSEWRVVKLRANSPHMLNPTRTLKVGHYSRKQRVGVNTTLICTCHAPSFLASRNFVFKFLLIYLLFYLEIMI